jgi:pimeloyl-ACP methyl ester carboxylesterase
MKTSPLLLALALAISGCAEPLAVVKHTAARYQPSPSATGEVRLVEQHIVAAEKLGPSDPLRAVGEYLSAADAALTRLRHQPSDAVALHDYNFALSRVFSIIHTGAVDPWSQPLTVPGYVVTRRKDERKMWNPADYNFIPTDELDVSGAAFTERADRPGLGATLVAARKTPVKDYRQQFLNSEYFFYGITAVVTFQGKRCEISLEDPLAQKTVAIAGETFPLAGDFSSAIAMMLVRDKPEKLGFARFVHPDKYTDTRLLFRLQPYDPQRIPVVFVHGLQDSPATWMKMFNTLLSDPEIRSAYQFWFFSYPSGDPFPYSATFLRTDLDAFDKKFPDHKPIVMVGHSMGGLITRLMVSDSGDGIWNYIFEKSPAQMQLSPADKALLESAIIFQHRKEIARAVFLSTPHRGSALATNWIGQIGRRLVHLPQNLVGIGNTVFEGIALRDSRVQLRRMPNSIDTLSPKASFIIALNSHNPSKSIPFHQIMGDRGRGDTPNSSDGVVAYWSSHLDGAQSTRIVPSGHGSHQNPEGIAEVRRILLLHLHQGSSARYPAASLDIAGDEDPDAGTDPALSQVIERPLPRLVDGDGQEPGDAVAVENHHR